MAKRNRNGNGTVLNLRDHQYPAAILNSQMVHPDPAHSWPGAPPEFGVIRPSHISTVQGWIGSQARTYPMEDEATRHSLQNCERMRRDPVIMECLKARQRAVALLPWSLQPEDESDPRQKQLVADLTSILERTYRFTEMRRYLMEAIWYGKSFVHLKYGVKPMRGRWRKVVAGWEPRHSDKILFRYSDGTKDYVAGQIGIRVNMHARDISREQLDATQYGLAYFLRDHERRVCICHKHEVEDGSYQDVFGTGRLHGVGVRDTVYWTWYASKEVEQKLLEYLDRTALGIEIWRYPSGNKEAEAAARKAATERIGGGRSIVLVPVIPGEQAELFGVQHIEPGPAGAELLKTICQEFYGHRIKRLIMGQVLTSEAEATGMGSGVAEAHLATFSDIIRYDAVNLEETLTEELVQIAKEENFPWARSIYIRMKLNTERPETEQKLSAYQAAWSMGLKVRAEDLYGLIGARRPDEEDDVLQNPNIMMAEQQQAMMMAQQGMPPPGAEQDPNAQGQPGDPTQVAMGGAGPAVAAMSAGAPPPGAPAEVSKDSAIEPAALPAGQTPDQPQNPWAGFWDSLFAAARGQGVAPPQTATGAVTQIPMPNGNGNPPVARGSKEELMRVFQERFDQAIRVRGQTAGQFRDALEAALAQQPDGDQLATTMQFLFAWKTAEPIGKLKAAFQRAMDEPAAATPEPTTTPLQQALETNLATQLDTRATLRDTLGQPTAAEPVKQAFKDAFTRQTAVREQLVQALRATGMAASPSVEQNAAALASGQAVDRYTVSQPDMPREQHGMSVPMPKLPELPEGHTRFTHFTSPRSAAKLLGGEDFSYHKQGLLDSTADAHSSNEQVHDTVHTGFANKAWSRAPFGTHVVLMDIPHQEARLHSTGKFETPAVHNSRIVGVVNRETGEFTPHQGYNPQQPHTNPVRPETGIRGGKVGTGGGVSIPQPSANQSASSVDVFTQTAALAPEQAVERYQSTEWTAAQLEAYALGRSHALGPDQYAKHKDSPGQRSLFGDDEPASSGKHDVKDEPRDASGEWTATGGKSEESHAPTGDDSPDVATIRQEETTSPTSGSETMTAQSASERRLSTRHDPRSGFAGYHVGQVVRDKAGNPLIVTEVLKPQFIREGQFEGMKHTVVARPTTSEEAAAADKTDQITRLQKQLDGMKSGPDDERDRAQFDRDRAAVAKELRQLRGEPEPAAAPAEDAKTKSLKAAQEAITIPREQREHEHWWAIAMASGKSMSAGQLKKMSEDELKQLVQA